MQCEYCQQQISLQLELINLLRLQPVLIPLICAECRSKFSQISMDQICSGCGRSGH